MSSKNPFLFDESSRRMIAVEPPEKPKPKKKTPTARPKSPPGRAPPPGRKGPKKKKR